MNETAAGLGSFLCRAILESGFADAQALHCYEAATQHRLGYGATVLLSVLMAIGLRRVVR